MTQADWIAVDWGTSHVRAWLMSRDGQVLARKASDQGMGLLEAGGFEPALLDLIGGAPAHDTLVVVCGMAGSRQGWHEAPYLAVPCAPNGDTAVTVPTLTPTLRVVILPGVKQNDPADVMRGEETQIAGFLALNPRFDGVICLPGTHCKWAHVSAGEIVSFRTCLTGELFSLLSRHSVLRHSVAPSGWNSDVFLSTVSDALAKPEGFAAKLFSLRANNLLHGTDPVIARAQLSGWVIGLELAATRAYWLGQQVALVGDDALTGPYAAALEAQGVPVLRTDADRMTLEGLKAAYAALKEQA